MWINDWKNSWEERNSQNIDQTHSSNNLFESKLNEIQIDTSSQTHSIIWINNQPKHEFDQNLSLWLEDTRKKTISYEELVSWTIKEINSDNLGVDDLNSVIAYFKKGWTASRSGFMNYIGSKFEDVKVSYDFMKEDADANIEELCNRQIELLDAMINKSYVIEKNNGKLTLNFKFIENSLNEFFGI